MLFYIFLIVFIVASILFFEINRQKPTQSIAHKSIEKLWELLSKVFTKFDSIIDRFVLKYTASSVSIRIFINNIDILLKTPDYNDNNHETLQNEIDQLTERLYDKYIHFWHEKILINPKNDDYGPLIRGHLRQILMNFYNHCKMDVCCEEILVKFTCYLK